MSICSAHAARNPWEYTLEVLLMQCPRKRVMKKFVVNRSLRETYGHAGPSQRSSKRSASSWNVSVWWMPCFIKDHQDSLAVICTRPLTSAQSEFQGPKHCDLVIWVKWTAKRHSVQNPEGTSNVHFGTCARAQFLLGPLMFHIFPT